MMYVYLFSVAAGSILGWMYGKNLHAAGLNIRQNIPFKKARILYALIILFVLVNLFFSICNHLSVRFPIMIERYESRTCMVMNAGIITFVFIAIVRIGFCQSWKKGLSNLLTGILIAMALAMLNNQFPYYFTGQPVQLNPFRLTPDGVVLQTNGSTCAAASGATIARHFGKMVTEEDMVKAMKTTDFGTMDYNIVDGLATVGLKAVRRHVKNDDIATVQPPAILIVDLIGWPDGHATVFMGLQDGKAEMWDPSGGKHFETISELQERWHGWVFEITQEK